MTAILDHLLGDHLTGYGRRQVHLHVVNDDGTFTCTRVQAPLWKWLRLAWWNWRDRHHRYQPGDPPDG